MLLSEIVETSAAVAATRSRKQKAEHLAGLMRRFTPEEVPIGAAWISGVLPQGRIGLGWAAFRDLKPGPPPEKGDLGMLEVHARLSEIGEVSGKGSKAAREQLLGALFARADAAERDFVTKLVLGELRQGALESLVIEGVAKATGLDAAAVRRATMLAGAVAPVAEAALLEGAVGLARFRFELFRPVLPMLASPAETIEAALAALGQAAFELKLDGARVQVHKAGDEVRVFTRRLHDVTAAVPEIVEAVRGMPARELVLDGEAIAFKADGTPHPFQTTMRRFGRRRDVEAMREKLPLSSVFFDCIYRDGVTLLDEPLSHRLELLGAEAGVFAGLSGEVQRTVTADATEAGALWDRAMSLGHEGLMAKSLSAPYEAGSRGKNWLKLKPTHTLDLVVLAVEPGSGRREGWLSNLHLGARDPKTGGFVMLGKTFKGLTDELLRWQTEQLRAIATREEQWVIHVAPKLVVEIAFNDVQKSPQYPAGLALRFARVKRYRPDKTAEQADTIDAVRAIFDAQP